MPGRDRLLRRHGRRLRTVLLVALQVLNAWFFAVVAEVGLTLFQQIIPRPGLASGLYMNTRRLGAIVSGLIISFGSMTALGYSGIFAVCAALTALALALIGVVRRIAFSSTAATLVRCSRIACSAAARSPAAIAATISPCSASDFGGRPGREHGAELEADDLRVQARADVERDLVAGDLEDAPVQDGVALRHREQLARGVQRAPCPSTSDCSSRDLGLGAAQRGVAGRERLERGARLEDLDRLLEREAPHARAAVALAHHEPLVARGAGSPSRTAPRLCPSCSASSSSTSRSPGDSSPATIAACSAA